MSLKEQSVSTTSANSSFREWHSVLCKFAMQQGGSAADAEAWREDYEAGKTPRQAWEDEWGINDGEDDN
ncbi:hypothetical protein DEEACLCL_00015 [Salmonella phage CRW-SP2]|nr:hypothetical protein DEEACLCL_00015 [Salmonella phage CRW-SP2]